jgi:hypothetical protein
MSFLGIQLSETPAGYRRRRFLAFVLDLALALLLVLAVYLVTGTPDYPGVKEAMDAVKEAGDGPETQELVNRVFSLFNVAYIETLLIWFAAEVLGQFFLQGASLGKFIMGLRILPMNPKMKLFVSTALKAADIKTLLENYREDGVSYGFVKKNGLKMEFEVSGIEGQAAVDLTKKIIRTTEYGKVLFFSVSEF